MVFGEKVLDKSVRSILQDGLFPDKGTIATAAHSAPLPFATKPVLQQPLALSRVPNIAGCEPVVALTPRCLRMRPVVDIHIEVVAKRKAEAIREDVDIAGYKTGEHCLTTSSNHRWLRSDSRRSSAAHCADPSRRSLCLRRLQLRLTGMHG